MSRWGAAGEGSAADVAHFLDRILFCLFAEDAGLLPNGIFQRLSEASHGRFLDPAPRADR